MRVLLVGAELEENLALRYLAAALEPKGHKVDLSGFASATDTRDVVEKVRTYKPDLIGMSMTFQFRAEEFGALAGALRESGFAGHITAGGHFPTFAHDEVLAAFPAIDSIVRHEGEQTLPELCEAVEAGGGEHRFSTILGLVYRRRGGMIGHNAARPLIENLDGLPFPKRVGSPQLHLGVPTAFMVGSRGCYGHCTFCCIHAYLKSAGGPKYRMRSAANIAEEMSELYHWRGIRMFVFHDDDFFTRDAVHDLARVTSLRDELKKRGVKGIALVVKARPDDVDGRVFQVLEEIGLLRVYLGIESGSTDGLKVLGRGVDLEENRRALTYLRERDVYTCYNMLVFDPESTIKGLRQSFDFVRKHAEVPMNFCRTEIYVGTPLMTKLAREGRLIGDVFGWDYVIRQPEAERAFRIFASAFLDRNFRCDGLMNSTLGVGYNFHLLRHFYPKAATHELRRMVDDVTRRVNLDCMDKMGRILDFAESPAAREIAAVEDFSGRMTREVNAANPALEAEVAGVTDALYRAAFEPKRVRSVGSRVQRSLAVSATAAAAMLVPLAGALEGCGEKVPPPPPPPDPLPDPVLIQGFDAGVEDAGGDASPGATSLPTGMIQPVDPPPPPVTTTKSWPSANPTDPVPPPTWKKPPPPPDPLPRPKQK
ncbi:MAG: cobalamin-dependent protein [Polyangiaceae bacterium]|nr:cobalamin-dependent protein [Polyangiaceae bacterium]